MRSLSLVQEINDLEKLRNDGVKPQSVAPIRSSLIKKGMIYSPVYGDTSFTVPLFDAFMLRTMSQQSSRLESRRLF
jgi:hypothetical protein